MSMVSVQNIGNLFSATYFFVSTPRLNLFTNYNDSKQFHLLSDFNAAFQEAIYAPLYMVLEHRKE